MSRFLRQTPDHGTPALFLHGGESDQNRRVHGNLVLLRHMDEEKAKALALFFGGEAWRSGGPLWTVLVKRADGSLVVIDEEAVRAYADYEAFDNGLPAAEIFLV